MTKKQLVAEIQVAEAQAWKAFKNAERLWGREDKLTTNLRTKWCTLFDLREALGITGLPIAELIDQNLLPA